MHQVLSENMDRIQDLCKRYNVKFLFAFGSVCADRFSENSDIDLLVTFHPMDYGDYADAYFELADNLEELLHRPVDLVTDKSLANPYFIDSVNKTKVLLYESRSQKVPV
ncbi:nucleotidyltransferase family protein [Telluribacter sp. SYSU D00476]|uniref:nucleotidyltransferase family protein n=1 Tax=Telluribacter sp. SYSU D00476 TaxID=2811430 RepID=UPI001FF200C3|nr:nucleotidyltransferase domain-containing protein [Telluribacter sp. SYSU D00476]